MVPVDLGILTAGDRDERVYELIVTRDGEPVDCRGASVTAYLIRSDRQTVVWTGQGTETGAVLTLPMEAHAVCGGVSLAVRLTMNGVQHTVFGAEGVVRESATEVQLDPCAAVPTLDEMLAQITDMETVRQDVVRTMQETTMNVSAALDDAALQLNAWKEEANGALNDAVQQVKAWEMGTNAALEQMKTETLILKTETVRQASGLAAADRRLTNLEAAAQGCLYRVETDETPAWEKSIPLDALPWAMLDRVEGRTMIWNQMSGAAEASTTRYTGVTFVKNGVTLTVTGTSTSGGGTGPVIAKCRIIAGHKYALKQSGIPMDQHLNLGLYRQAAYTNANRVAGIELSPTNSANGEVVVNTALESCSDAILSLVLTKPSAGTTYDFVCSVMLFDLTLMFGAGHEPTAEQFKTMFPGDAYPYAAARELTLMPRRIDSYDADGYLIASYDPAIIGTEDDCIRVGAGGWLEFINDAPMYNRVPVPNAETWLIRLAGGDDD